MNERGKEIVHYFLTWFSVAYYFSGLKKYHLWALVLTRSSTSHSNAGGNELVDIKATLSRKQVLSRREYADLLSSS